MRWEKLRLHGIWKAWSYAMAVVIGHNIPTSFVIPGFLSLRVLLRNEMSMMEMRWRRRGRVQEGTAKSGSRLRANR